MPPTQYVLVTDHVDASDNPGSHAYLASSEGAALKEGEKLAAAHANESFTEFTYKVLPLEQLPA